MSLIDLPAPLILASESRYRRAQLERFGIPFEAMASPIDETVIVADTPRQTIALRAAFKACALQEMDGFSETWIIGADQGVVLSGEAGQAELIGKPGTPEAAVAQLMRLSSRTHELFTAVALAVPGGRLLEAAESVRITMRAFSVSEAEAIVQQDETWDCAGSYKIERAAPWLIDRIEANDPTSIEGLPMIALGQLLRQAWSGA
ncbi:MAG: Maf-like protein [Myxococcales bacterium]|nr:Maf-like protein [Myxococcales bacterium]